MKKRTDRSKKNLPGRKKWRTRLGRWVEKRLSLKKRDAVNRFRIQTRLLFSRTIFLLLAAMFAFFTFATLKSEKTLDEKDVFYLLLFQSVILSILLHMGLWEREREAKTFELLVMRIPNLHQLIWFKLRVSMSWTLVLTLPFFAGYTWFLSIPLHRMALYLLFCQMVALAVAFLVCVVASFVHRGLPTGIIVAILIWILGGITEGAPLPYKDYYRPLINPLDEGFDSKYTLFEKTRFLIVNRAVLLALVGCLYWWFHQRLKKIEKWIA